VFVYPVRCGFLRARYISVPDSTRSGDPVASDQVRELLTRPVTPELYGRVLQEWKTHSLAEDARDIAGLISTLTDDCVYQTIQTGHRWEGHAGATQFYTELLTAFPDIHFDLTNIVAGPQGVCEEAQVTGTFVRDWLGFHATGAPVQFRVVIFFPWDLAKAKFTGERIYFDAGPS
jgi:predicted ester cyclase